MKLLVLVLMLGALAACPNYATLQEADTLPAGATKFGVGATGTYYKFRAIDGSIDTFKVPALNFWYRRGLTDVLEGHVSVWIPFGGSAGLKYQVTGNRQTAGFSFSFGIDLGALQITTTGDNDEESTTTIVDTYVPLYFGFRTGPGFAVYGSPKLILRTGFGEGETTFSQLAGGTAGIALGEKTTLHLEGTLMYDLDVEAPAAQVGVGVAF
ncbi:MAG TPA: hypothetical protein VNO30_30730 [Kofleriaceae bacterium]|nr:hypothetical protein [Kofleriaceae bacterium]